MRKITGSLPHAIYIDKLQISGSQLGDDTVPQIPFGNVWRYFCCHNSWGATDIWGAAKHPTMLRTAAHNRELLRTKCQDRETPQNGSPTYERER